MDVGSTCMYKYRYVGVFVDKTPVFKEEEEDT